MNKELLMILAMGLGGTLFAIGGLGPKWARRYLLPLFLGIVAYIGGKSLQNSIYFAISLSLSLHLPYGERTPYWLKMGVFSAIFATTLFLGVSIWQGIGIIVTFGLFKISNTKWGQYAVPHKIFEFICGGLLGVVTAHLIGR